jgi:hypothetical protein
MTDRISIEKSSDGMYNHGRHMRHLNAHLGIVILSACVAACGSGHLRVTGIQLGRSLNADNTVAHPTTSFSPNDTICLSVQTAGVGSGTFSVRWKYGEHVVDEPKKQVSYRDVAATDFQLQSPAGFPAGDYTAEVFLDGQSLGTKEFHVQ